jgi:hypothetical protein
MRERYGRNSEALGTSIKEADETSKKIGLTMEAVTMTVEWLYLSLNDQDSSDFTITRKQISEAIKASDLR